MLNASAAQTIARKLQAELKNKSRRHQIAVIRVNGKEVGRFGIRRGSGDLPHDYIPSQIHVTNQQANNIVACTIWRENQRTLSRLTVQRLHSDRGTVAKPFHPVIPFDLVGPALT